MIARIGQVPDPRIDTGGSKSWQDNVAQQKMIDAQPKSRSPAAPEIVPVRVDPLVRVDAADGVGPSLP